MPQVLYAALTCEELSKLVMKLMMVMPPMGVTTVLMVMVTIVMMPVVLVVLVTVLVTKGLEGKDIRTHLPPQPFLIASPFLPLLLPPSRLPLTPVSLPGQLFPELSASLRSPGMEGVGRSSLAHPFSIQPHPSLSGERTPPQGWTAGSLAGTPDLTHLLSGPVLAAPPRTCLCLGRFLCQELPSSPFMRTQIYHVSSNPMHLRPHLWSLSNCTSEPRQVWEESQACRPRQTDPGGLGRPGPLTPARGLPSLPSGQRNRLPHQLLWP